MSLHGQIAAELHRELVDLASRPAEEGRLAAPEHVLEQVLAREAPLLPPEDRAEVRRLLVERTVGLGPLESLLDDPDVDEIMVLGTRPVWVERRGRIEATSVRFADGDELLHAIERMLAGAGRRVDRSEPLCDARLPDGSRLHVALPPVSVDGPSVTIRRFRDRSWTAEELVARGTWTPTLGEAIAGAVRDRRSILVSGGTGAGKTTTLAAIAGLLDPGERIVTVEDTAELRLTLPHVVRLEARTARGDGQGAIAIRDLVRNALRMRPDRRRRGPRRRGARHGARDDHRPRRVALHDPRPLARVGAAAARDALPHGRLGTAARRRAAARRRRDRARPAAGAPRGRLAARDRRPAGRCRRAGMADRPGRRRGARVIRAPWIAGAGPA
jgi:pilus assembly protein CpaF